MNIYVSWKAAVRMLSDDGKRNFSGWATSDVFVRLLEKYGDYQFTVISWDQDGFVLEFDDPQHALLFRLKYL